jgi:phosphoribosyl-AMP cyclohydrolase
VQERDNKVFVSDYGNHRVLIYNSVPTANNASANVVVGQANMTGETANQGGAAAANTLSDPHGVYCDGTRFFISDYGNHRILIFNSVPESNNPSADKVIGQASFTGASANQGGAAAANTLNKPYGMILYDKYLIAADRENSRVLFFEVGPADGLTVSPTTLSYSKKKSQKTTITITAHDVNLSKRKKNWVKVKFNGKKANVLSVKNSGDNLTVRVKLKYGKWSRKSYDLSSFKYKTSKNGSWTTRSKTDAITIQ